MAIVPIPLQNCKSVKEFFKNQGKVEIPRPQQCLNAKCRLKEPLWKNGSYVRQVIYWGFLFFCIHLSLSLLAVRQDSIVPVWLVNTLSPL